MAEVTWTISTCRSCGAEMIWAVSEAGKPQPFDAVPDPAGNRRLEDRGVIVKGRRVPTAVPHDTDQSSLFDDPVDVFMPHHATCPEGRQWRRG